MNKLRDSTGVVLWILVFAFGVIWVLQDAGTMDVIGNPGTTIIEVDGEKITYEDYAAAVEQRMQQYRQQYGDAMPLTAVEDAREQVFELMVDDRLREREMERLGIEVTDDEVFDMIMGDDPHQVVKLYFSDGQGGVDRALLQNFIDNPESEEQLRALEDFLRTERRRAKLDDLIAATVRVSESDARAEFEARNRRADARYVALRYASLPDDSISVGERDLRAFYDRNREDFAQPRSYSLRYVTASKAPTAADTANVSDDLARVRQGFASAENDSLFIARNGSEQPYTGAYYTRGDLPQELQDALFPNPTVGQVYGPVFVGSQAHLVKVTDLREAETPSYQARHILVSAPEGDNAARAAAREQIAEARARIQGGASFADVAAEVSQDPGSARRGGDLGWFKPDAMVAPFADAVRGATVGRLVGPVETRFGVHLIEVTGRSTQEVQLANYVQSIRAGAKTLTETRERLEDVKYFAEEGGAFEEEAERLGLAPATVDVEADQRVIPGIGRSGALQNFLVDAEAGDVSDVIELDDRYVVVLVEDVREEGYRAFADVRDEIEPRVRIEKKREKLAQRMRATYERTGFDGLAQALGTTVRNANGVAMSTPVVSGLGNEPAFVGTAIGLPEGGTSGVIEGRNAVYVLQVTKNELTADITDANLQQLRTQLEAQRKREVLSQWISALRDQADVQDYRRRFYQ